MSAPEERACPSAADLLDYAESRLAQPDTLRIRENLAHCGSCTKVLDNLRNSRNYPGFEGAGPNLSASVPEDIRRLFAERSTHFRKLMALSGHGRPGVPAYGEIWTTKLDVDDSSEFADSGIVPRIVIVFVAEAESSVGELSHLVVVPVSLDIAYQTNLDLLVLEEENPLGYRFMIEVWNEVPMLGGQLGRYLGALPQPIKRYLGLLYQAHLGVEVDLSEFAERLGPAIRHSADPRVRFQGEEIEACAYLRRPLLERVERQTAGEEEPTYSAQGVVLFQRKLSVKHEELPQPQGRRRDALPLAAAVDRTESVAHFVYTTYANEEILGVLIRDFPTRSLCMVWERLPSRLEGKLARLWTHTRTGETYSVEHPAVRQGELTCLIKGIRLTPSQVESVSLEFINRGPEDAGN